MRNPQRGLGGRMNPPFASSSLTPDLQLTHVIAKGKVAMKQGRLLMKGTFEE